jgi:hypothetical protein
VVAFVFAILGESVHELVAESSALGSSGIVVAGLFGLFTRFGGARAALVSVLAGAATYVCFEHVLESDVAYLISLGAALVGYTAGAVLPQGEAAVAKDQSADAGARGAS